MSKKIIRRWRANKIKIEQLVGKTFRGVEKRVGTTRYNPSSILFEVDDNERYLMTHKQECCEEVRIEDICGNLADLIGSPILTARENINESNLKDGLQTWSFYDLATIKGAVTIRWHGTSNGHYSERVDIIKKVKKKT